MKLILAGNQYHLLTDDEIKVGDYAHCYIVPFGGIFKVKDAEHLERMKEAGISGYAKCIASTSITQETQELRKLDLHKIEIMLGKADVKKLANDYVSTHHDEEVRRMYGHHFRSFVAGFSKCQEINSEKKFTLQDMNMAYKCGYNTARADSGEMVISKLPPMIPDNFELILNKTEWDVYVEEIDSIDTIEIKFR